MQVPDHIAANVGRRVARAEGQLRGVQAMLDEGRDCREIVGQMRAAERALQRARVHLLAAGMRYCAQHPDREVDIDELEALLVASS